MSEGTQLISYLLIGNTYCAIIWLIHIIQFVFLTRMQSRLSNESLDGRKSGQRDRSYCVGHGGVVLQSF